MGGCFRLSIRSGLKETIQPLTKIPRPLYHRTLIVTEENLGAL